VDLLSRLSGGVVYLDANVLIYAIERIPEFTGLVAPLVAAIDEGRLRAVSSELTLAEVLVKPLRDGNEALAADYRAALHTRDAFAVVPVSRGILQEAARIRARGELRLPDAIHAATALHAGCTHLLTNDPHFRSLEGVDVILLADLTA
jgi:predicted nucleic acid-binding protein